MTQGCWLLVSHFYHQGRLYLLTRRVEPEAAWALRLTPSELRAVYFALNTKYPDQSSLAAAMDINESTLATHLSRAMKKLGVRLRSELLAVFCFQPIERADDKSKLSKAQSKRLHSIGSIHHSPKMGRERSYFITSTNLL